MTERTKRTIEIWDQCECGNVLHSIVEGERGTCGSCWIKAMPADTKLALNKLIAAAFTPMTPEAVSAIIDDAFEKVDRDRSQGK